MIDVQGLRPIDDDEMRARLGASRPYSLVILTKGPNYGPDAYPIIWEHGRRNMQLNEAGILAVVLPIRDDSEFAGVGVFALDIDETNAVMAGDPAVSAGVLVCQVHPAAGFPGNALPA